MVGATQVFRFLSFLKHLKPSRSGSESRCPMDRKVQKTFMTMQNVYDLAVIGAGPAGIVGATTAASLGARVVLIDRYGDLGGAGANTGTVPSKTMRETALSLSGIRSRDLYGVDLSLRREEATVADLMRGEHAVKEALNMMDLLIERNQLG